MKHIYIKGQSNRTLILFHGTGGSENDLIGIGQAIDAKANILSVRGNVSEHGMARYFRRIKEGVFDEKDLTFRTHELYEFLIEASNTYDFDLNNLVGFGYSNGANILSSLIFHYPNLFQGAVLSHPMIPYKSFDVPRLEGLRIFIGAGENDPLVQISETQALKDLYVSNKADVTMYMGQQGHRLSQVELDQVISWYQ